MKPTSNNLEDLFVYRQYVLLEYYTYMITRKFPSKEQFALVADIKHILTKGLECLILAQKAYDLKDRLHYLNRMDVYLKVLKVKVRIAYKFKYITSHNYGAWSRKIANVSNCLGGWIKSCQKQ